MMPDNDERHALADLAKADRRYRTVLYIITLTLFGISIWALLSLKVSLTNGLQDYTKGAISRANARQEETKTIARESIRYNTCIYILPIDQRTPAAQQKCFDQANLKGGLERSDFSTTEDGTFPDTVSAGTSTQSGVVPNSSQQPSSSSSSSPKTTPATTPAQSNNVQQNNTPPKQDGVTVDLPLLPPVHIPSPF